LTVLVSTGWTTAHADETASGVTTVSDGGAASPK